MTANKRGRFALGVGTSLLMAAPFLWAMNGGHGGAGVGARDDPAAGDGGPIVITRGGTYRGKWRGTDADTPAVTVRTAEPVIIEGSEVSARTHLIVAEGPHANVTVRDCRGVGMNPGVAGRCPGRFFHAEYFDSVVLENNDLEGTSGIYLLNYRGDPRVAPAVKVIGNRARNVDGRKSDGRGGFLDFNKRVRAGGGGGDAETGFRIVQFVQLNKVRDAPGVEVAWNEVVNEPGKSRVEDNINIFLSSGTPASPILVHDNYIQGAYTVRPWQGNTGAGGYDEDWGYSGGGILLGDGPPDDPAGASAFVRGDDNQVVSTTNHGLAVAAGHDITFSRNRVVSSGTLPDGRSVAAQNVGAYVWDLYHGKRPGTFYNNGGRGNLFAWMKGGRRNDWWVPDADAAAWAGNVHLPDDPTPAAEAAEYRLWREKLARAKRSVGPRAGR